MRPCFALVRALLLALQCAVLCLCVNDFSMPSTTPECTMEVDECTLLSNSTVCLGVQLPYTMSSNILVSDSNTTAEVLKNLELWSGLRNVPKCWEVVQPMLCSVYMPKCVTDGNTSKLYLPPREFCDITRGPCKIVESYGWPSFLTCNQSHFVSGCSDQSAVKPTEFNTTGTCEAPLVATENRNSWYRDIDGCGVQCQNPLFTEAEHNRMHIFIAAFGSLCMATTLFTIVTFIIDWKNSSRYPSLILFFINGCFFIGSLGWMAQFIPGARNDIVCRSDGTMRIAEPQLGSGETASCSVVFFLVYYFMMSGVTWFVILTYCWYLMFRALRSPVDVIEAKRGTFHVCAWSVPLVLTIVCLALAQIDGDSVSGICFVGYLEHGYRGGFVLAPIGLVMVIGLIFLVLGLVTLVKIKLGSPGLISDRASAKITDTIIRLGTFAAVEFIFVFITFAVHLYIFTNEKKWQKSFSDYIFCEGNVTNVMNNRTSTCQMAERPNLVAMQIHVFSYFGAGMAMSSWVWNMATLRTWKRFLRKCWGLPDDDPVKVRKHQVIAQAFSKRHELNHGRLSLSFKSTHDDPLGLRFDLNSLSSHEVSSVWAAAIPRLIQRRGGLTQRRYSDSDLQSIASVMDQISGVISDPESRRHSVQSHNSGPGSHNSHPSSGQEDKQQQLQQQKKQKRRKRRKRGVNRIAPTAVAVSTEPGSTAASSRLGSFEHVSSLGTGDDSRCHSSSMATGDEVLRCESVSSLNSNSDPKADGVVNLAYEESQTERSRTINRVFRIQASPNSAFSPYRKEQEAEEGEDGEITPVPSPQTLSIASSDTEAMSVKEYDPEAAQVKEMPPPNKNPKSPSHKIIHPQPIHPLQAGFLPQTMMFHGNPIGVAPTSHPMQVYPPHSMPHSMPALTQPHSMPALTQPHINPTYTLPNAVPAYSMPNSMPPSGPAPMPHSMPYTIPVAPPQFTALHAHTTYSMLQQMYAPYNLPRMPDVDTPILPIGMPVPPVPYKRRKTTPTTAKDSVHQEDEPRHTHPKPTVLPVLTLPGATDVIEMVELHHDSSHTRVKGHTETILDTDEPSPSKKSHKKTGRKKGTHRSKKNRISVDPDAVVVINSKELSA